MRAYYERSGSAPQQPAAGRDLMTRATDFALAAGRMVPFSDEIRTAGRAAADIATGGPVEGSWTRARQQDDAEMARSDQNVTGMERVAADTAGMLIPGLAGMRAVQGVNQATQGATGAAGAAINALTNPASSATGRIAQGAVAGAAGGTVAGLSEGRGLEDRLDNFEGLLNPATAGMLLGAGISTIPELTSALPGILRQLSSSSNSNAAGRRAAERIMRRLDFDNLTPEEAVGAVRQLQDEGVEASILDVSPQVGALGRTIINQPGPGSTPLRRFSGERQQNIRPEVDRRFRDAMYEDPDNLYDITPSELRRSRGADLEEELHDRVTTQTSPMFDSVRDTVPLNDTVRMVLNDPTMQPYIQRAGARIRADRQAGRIDYDMPASFEDLSEVDIRVIHRIRQALDRQIFVSGRGQVAEGAEAERTYRNLLDNVMKTNDEWRTADVTHRFLMQGMDGFDFAKTFDQETAASIRDWMEEATPAQQFIARVAVARRLSTQMANRADPTTLWRPGGARSENIEAMFGDPESAEAFMRHVRAQDQIATTNQTLGGNSTTAGQAANAEFEGGQQLANTIGAAVSGGGAGAALRQTFGQLVRHLPGKMSDEELEAISRIMMETDLERLETYFGGAIEDAASRTARAQQRGQASSTAAGTAASGAILNTDEERP